MVTMIYPESLLTPGKVDEFFAKEVKELDTQVSLFNDTGKVSNIVEDEEYLYRGWILDSNKYRDLAEYVVNKGASLVVTPTDYDKSQFVSGWYPYFEHLTPDTAVLPFNAPLGTIEKTANSIGYPLVIKGESKSLKDYWEEGMFIRSQVDLIRVVEFFKEHSDPWEGIVFRKYEEWENSEWRTWWVNGQHVLSENHGKSKSVLPISSTDLLLLEDAVLALGSVFCTVDITFTKNSQEMRVVEVGSGCVSECHDITSVIK